MAFTKRVWLPHDVQYPSRKILLPTGNPNEYDLVRSEGTVTTVGDLTSVENLAELETRIFNQFGIVPEVSDGTWTPTLYGTTTAGSPTYTYHDGTYTKIGKIILLKFNLGISGLGGMTGLAKIGGLPFAGSGVINFFSCADFAIQAGQILVGASIDGNSAGIQSSSSTIITDTNVSELNSTFFTVAAHGYMFIS